MYHALVRRRVRRIFDELNRGNYPAVVAGARDDVHHVFAGDHPLGGERHSRAGLERWFERVYRLFPGLRFEVKEVAASGPPWRTVAAIEWVAHADPPTGRPYLNTGAHVLRIRWGKATHIHAYEDSQTVAEACRLMAERGVEEAAAPPVAD